MNNATTDLTFLKTFTGDDHERMVKYINNFLELGPEKVSAMKVSLKEKNWEELRSAAHKIKPQLSYMGINSIKDDILKIEEYAAEAKNLEELPALVEKVTAVCNDAFGELRQFVNGN